MQALLDQYLPGVPVLREQMQRLRQSFPFLVPLGNSKYCGWTLTGVSDTNLMVDIYLTVTSVSDAAVQRTGKSLDRYLAEDCPPDQVHSVKWTLVCAGVTLCTWTEIDPAPLAARLHAQLQTLALDTDERLTW